MSSTLDLEKIDEWNRTIKSRLSSSAHRNSVIFLRTVGMMTVLGSGYIIQDVVKDEARRKRTKNKIMLFMSICDFLHAFDNSVLGPAMVPKGIGVPGAAGNHFTCDVQGFVAYATGAASGMYNVSLALCYLLMVRYEYSDEQLRALEPYFLRIPLFLSLLMAITGLPFGIYNLHRMACFINTSPLDCDHMGSPVECERGELYNYWYTISSVFIGLGTCVIVFCMVKMYTAVLQQERNGDRFRFSAVLLGCSTSRFSATINRHSTSTAGAASSRTSTTTSLRSESRQESTIRSSGSSIGRRHSFTDRILVPRRDLSNTMRSQGLWYSGAFLFTFFPIFLYFLWPVQPIYFFVLITFHLIGFTNAVIYVRPRFLKFRRDHRNIGATLSIWYTLTRKRPASGDVEPFCLRVTLDRFRSGMKSFLCGKIDSSDDDFIATCQERGKQSNERPTSTIPESQKEAFCENNEDDSNSLIADKNGLSCVQNIDTGKVKDSRCSNTGKEKESRGLNSTSDTLKSKDSGDERLP